MKPYYSRNIRPKLLENSRPVSKDSIDTEKLQLQIDLQNLKADANDREEAISSSKYLISILAAKLGTILILIYLVNVLFITYRYQVRMVAFYDSRADALELVGTTDMQILERAVQCLTPEGIDLGRTPKSPTHNVLDAAKNAMSIVGRK